MMADPIYLAPWQQPALVRQATRVGADHRLSGTLDLTFVEETSAGQTPAGGALTYSLMAPADVTALVRRAIRHRAPAPATPDAEATKLVHVDFHAPDLPWRLTPEPSGGGAPRPWLALLVASAEELAFDGRVLGYSRSTRLLLAEPCHDLDLARAWAHVQAAGPGTPTALGPSSRRFSRILSLKQLEPQHSYVAMLVPIFNRLGEPMWDRDGRIRNENRPIPVLDSWRFATGEAGDFESLAAALHAPDPGSIGRAALTYARAGIDFGPPMDVRGALASLRDRVEPASLGPVGEDLLALHRVTAPPGGADLLALPEYGHPWVAAPATAGPGWVEELRVDPRHRVAAGTGVWMGVAAQDELMRAAAEQAGALREASDRVAQLAAGLVIGGRLWRRALPADPEERLDILGPMMARLVAGDGRIVVDAVTGDTTRLTPGLFSSAAQRLLRHRRTGASEAGNAAAPAPSAQTRILRHVNETASPRAEESPEPAPPDSLAQLMVDLGHDPWRGLEEQGVDRATLRRVLEEAVGLAHRAAEGVDAADPVTLAAVAAELQTQLQITVDELTGGISCSELMWLAASEDVGLPRDYYGFCTRLLSDPSRIESLVYDVLQPHLVHCLLRCDERPDDPGCRDRRRSEPHLDPPDRTRPIDLVGLSTAVQAVLDPRLPGAPARGRVLDRIVPRPELTPMRYPLGIDFPTWSLLRQHEPEWLLPGAESLAKDSVTALQTNPSFIDAYLVGINTQLVAEARWRGMAIDRWGTPLKMFFGPVGEDGARRGDDITPIATWPVDSPLGARSHQAIRAADADPDATERLVIVFRSALFRRYPRTVVYLHKGPGDDADLSAVPQFTPPAAPAARDAWYRARRDFAPAFTGSLDPDRVFFGFDVAPDDLDAYWLMLDEPPTELRFRLDGPTEVVPDAPTRVAISGAMLRRIAGGGG